MQCVAFVTYNAVGDNLSNGWHEGPNGRRALVLQNTKGEGTLQTGPIGEARRREEIGILWSLLQEALPNLDQVVIYLGVRGCERAIELAGQLPASKVTFVACDCSLEEKELLVQEAGLSECGRILCECGGHRTMRRLYDRFMATGSLKPEPEPALN